MWRAWLPVLLCLLVRAALASSSEWQALSDDDGIVLESRQVDEAPQEVRATTWTDVPVAAIMRVLWAHEEQPRFVPHLEYAAIVRDGLDERIVYQQIAIPVLRDRDLVVRARRAVDPATGVADVTTAAIGDEGPPETSAFVRVHDSVGHWHLAPALRGGTDVTYTLRTDLGGGIPAMLLAHGQRSNVPRLIRAVIARARNVDPPVP